MRSILLSSILLLAATAAQATTIYFTDSDATRIEASLRAALRNSNASSDVIVQNLDCVSQGEPAEAAACTLTDSRNQTIELPADDSAIVFNAFAALEQYSQPYPILKRTRTSDGIGIHVDFVDCESNRGFCIVDAELVTHGPQD